jgi:hypothetical protein
MVARDYRMEHAANDRAPVLTLWMDVNVHDVRR